MGMIWRFKMVLLSTLAALVIIAHSAQEDYEAQYMREFRPRMLDTGTPRTYEQPWRTMDVEPVIKKTTPEETWFESSSEEPRRRKTGRKRKRRPEPASAEDLIPVERYTYPEESVRPFVDEDFNADRQMSTMPKRRRKKLQPRPDRWDSPLEERPLRRRGQRRKRPSQEAWPEFSELSEFSDFRSKEPKRDIDEQVTTSPMDTVSVDDYRQFDRDNTQTYFTQPENEHLRQPIVDETDVKLNGAQDDIYVKQNTDDLKHEDNMHIHTEYRDDDSQRRPLIEEKSLSEFTYEDIGSARVQNTEDEEANLNSKVQSTENEQRDTKSKVSDKMPGYFTEAYKSQNNGPIDPLTLKDILKKSNGTSLSEILQQHNLSLTDLLHGKEQVLSILKSEDSVTQIEKKTIVESEEDKVSSEEKVLSNAETKYTLGSTIGNSLPTQIIENVAVDTITEADMVPTTTEKAKVEEVPKRPNIRRFPTAMRRKQRIRPMLNTTFKSQVSRDMIALNAKKYFNNRRRNSTHEWKDLIPMMKKNISIENIKRKPEIETMTTVNNVTEETTTVQDYENCTKSPETESEQENTSENIYITEINSTQLNNTDIDMDSYVAQPTISVTDKSIIQPTTTQAVNASVLRRQAFNNRLKKKRLRQKNLTIEPPQDDIVMSLFGMPNLVSSSEFISHTQGPKTRLDDVTILEDFMTTEMPRKPENRTKSTRFYSTRSGTTPKFVFMPSSTEETAKIEIEEIFNDTQTSARLSKILKERNMTLSELVDHRERGSSHVHLADIFHNASKEPNPPEPFLSKSLLEPISKETYPLRALLDAKATTTDPGMPAVQTTDVNIPIIMDFGNNVNENAENMGIMSLFHNITKNGTDSDKTILKKDSQGTLYETSITIVNTTDDSNENDTIRESRVIHVINDNQDDIVSWNEIFSLMRKNYENQTGESTRPPTNGLIPAEKIKKPSLEQDLDGDGVIVLEDLQHLKDFDSNIESASNENLEINTYERAETPTTKASNILDKVPSQTKSVTVAAASIAGLAMVLFLLTYIGYKWQQHRTMARKKSFSEERVPSPVFENRKGHKNNSSSRSISPMLSSNIYTLNTLDSRNGKESPDYMWDSLRKPFQ